MPVDIQQLVKRVSSLENERSGYIDYWRELADNILTYRGKFLIETTKRNKRIKRNTKQINNIPRQAVRTLASGMMSGITSPARPWFRLSISDSDLREREDVKLYLNDVTMLLREIFAESNLYNVLHTTYMELVSFGTASMGVYSDFENVIWCKNHTIGSYLMDTDGRSRVDTFSVKSGMTVKQVVDEFGYENVSARTKGLYDNRNFDSTVDVVNLIEPNRDRDTTSVLSSQKKFRSVYFEMDGKNSNVLRESGYDEFPIMTPRWDIVGEDVYGGDCPAMLALGDCKALQLLERRKHQAIGKVVNPPMQAPSTLRSQVDGKGFIEGDIIYVADTSNGGVRSLYDYRPDINAIEIAVNETENRINKAFYVDLFLMLSNTDRREITAREVAERHEEKLLALGPVLERLQNELLDPLIDRVFSIAHKSGILPEPPKGLDGNALKVDYVSVLAQAQKMVAISGIERTASFVGQLAQLYPDVRNKFDALQAVDEYSDALGVSPRIIVGDDDVEAKVKAEQEQMQQQQQMEQAQQMAETAATASKIDTSNDNFVTDTMRAAGLQ